MTDAMNILRGTLQARKMLRVPLVHDAQPVTLSSYIVRDHIA